MGEEQSKLGGEETESGEALAVNEDLTSVIDLKEKFFKKFIKLQSGQSLSDRIGELENRQSGIEYIERAI